MKHFLASILILMSNLCLAQNESNSILSSVNKLISPENIITIQRKSLIIEGFREGEKVKTDKVNYFDLNPKSVSYSEADGIVSISCHEDMSECVERHLLLDGQKNFRKRIAFGMSDHSKAEQLVGELRNLITSLQNK